MADFDKSIDTAFEPHVSSPKKTPMAKEHLTQRTKALLYRDVAIIKTISKAKFSVYLAYSKTTKQNYAMKIFPLEEGRCHPYFKNEARFALMNHPNIIKTVHVEQTKNIVYKGSPHIISYILTEFAPHGDFFDLVTKFRASLDEKLIRTYFKHLIEGLEYLHNKDAAHLDLKLENLLLGSQYELQIADFDLSYMLNDQKILTKGTKFYRAPELAESQCRDVLAADIYSAGVILFVFKSGGLIPHSESAPYKGIDLQDLLHNNNTEFWKKHCDIQNRSADYFDADFRELFNGMVKYDAEERFTIEQVKNSKWYKGSTFTKEELKACVQAFMDV